MNPISAGLPDLKKHKERKKWNPLTLLFIFICVTAFVMLVTDLAALIFPGLGIPFLWIAFPIGPQPPPVG